MALRMQKPLVRTADISIAKPSPKVTESYYGSAEHKAWVAAVIKRDGGICRDPLHKGRREGLRCVADHIKERRDHPELQSDISNGITRCWSCHTRKTAEVRAARMRATPEGGGSQIPTP